MNDSPLRQRPINRRRFIKRTTEASAFTAFITSGLRAQSPNNKLNIAAIGVGGMGVGNIEKCAGENIVALCDVDFRRGAETFKQHPKAKRFKDFRVMFDKMANEIDAVIIATPDHTHAVATMEAMRRGKHVHTQKPLTHSIWEARQLTEAAANLWLTQLQVLGLNQKRFADSTGTLSPILA